MAITTEQRLARRQYIGSSDIAAILGLSPWRSAADVYISKTQELDDKTNDAMDAGNRLESVVLDWAQQQIGQPFERDVMRVYDPMAANFDGISPGDLPEPFVVESKTTGITGIADAAYDLQFDDDTGLPDHVIVQATHQLFVAGPEYRIAWVPVLIGGYGFKLYRLARNDGLVDAIVEAAQTFMAHHVRLGIPPANSKPSLEILKRIRRVPSKTVPVADEIVDRWIVMRAARLQAEKDEAEAQAEVLAAMGDAEAATFGKGTITYLLSQRKGYTVAPSEYRQLRIKKGA
jgi:putative phage-type endonuclease